MSQFNNYREAKCGASLGKGILTLEDGTTFPFSAMLEFVASVEATGDTSDDGESYMCLGNVDRPTLEELGKRERKLSESQGKLHYIAQHLMTGYLASFEHPGYLKVVLNQVYDLHVGDVNGYFGAELWHTDSGSVVGEVSSFRLPFSLGINTLADAIKGLLAGLISEVHPVDKGKGK